jgi:hypothetical protein
MTFSIREAQSDALAQSTPAADGSAGACLVYASQRWLESR